MGARGEDADAEARIQAVAGLALGAFGAAALYTGIARAESLLAAAGVVAGMLAIGFVAFSAVRLRRIRHGADGAGAADDPEDTAAPAGDPDDAGLP
ncbi:hypothetical protein [Streptomonospora salina]|uniref:Tetrahydromethanopterin S-methyltransferase subunit D n=1 Tax=Streptomonospora salina TaxID=104205 RepID=A0A841E692_9ACTN|nr:hypothetical protein [Streptomonospora salina]MBB5998526.1 tetrahydromethanopterin S-methyltransferase subunit D [Streptomonospora salina]